MVELNDVLVHIDPQGDLIAGADLHFEGWVAARQAITGVWLTAEKTRALPLGERPDVLRVFPDRVAVGFSGRARARHLGSGGLRLTVQVGGNAFDVEHPLPPALPRPALRQRIIDGWKAAVLRWRGRLTSDPAVRWSCTLRRHLIYRRQRANAFRRPHTDALLKDFAVALPEATVVQIGANDGFTGDPLRPLLMHVARGWRGVLVEPVEHLYTQLTELYRDNSRLRCERVAISEAGGTAEIHRLRTGAGDPLWLEQLASLDLELLRQSARQFGFPDAEIITERVPALTVPTLLERHRLTRLDLVVIDAEGWDWRVLRQFDLAQLQPRLILFEHQHLAAEERAAAHEFLLRHGYDWAETPEGDTIAWQQSAAS